MHHQHLRFIIIVILPEISYDDDDDGQGWCHSIAGGNWWAGGNWPQKFQKREKFENVEFFVHQSYEI